MRLFAHQWLHYRQHVGLWVDEGQERACVGIPEPVLGWCHQLVGKWMCESPFLPLEMGVTASGLRASEYRAPVITFGSLHCVPPAFYWLKITS